MRFRLRTLLIVLAVLPPAIACAGPPIVRAIQEWLDPETDEERFDRLLDELTEKGLGL